jgi:hypothetical protein
VLFSSSMPTPQMTVWAHKIISAHRWLLYSANPATGLPSSAGETNWGAPVGTGTAHVRLTANIPTSVKPQSGTVGSLWYLQAQAPPVGTRAGGC